MSNKHKPYYVYVIRDPRRGERNVPRYVGKGSGNRSDKYLRAHHQYTTLQLRGFFRECRRLGLVPPIKRVAYFQSETSSFSREKALIKRYGRLDLGTGTLFNQTAGGQGTSGYKLPPEKRKAKGVLVRKLWRDSHKSANV